jgi:hypothetical protein
MKFNWGTKITLVYLLFVAGIMFLVLQSSRQKIDLVTPDYYEQEIKYQQRIDQSKRAEALTEKLSIERTGDSLIIKFPKEQRDREINCQLWFYYPADESLDVKADIRTNNGLAVMVLPRNEMRSGMSILKTTWACEGIEYYTETILPPCN